MNSYQETLDYLYSQLPMFQRTGPAAYKNNLDNTNLLDELYNHPHRAFKTIHVAGTNGKGSVSHMLASVLQEAGYKTGLYTSPHLKDFRERIKINGQMIPEQQVTEFVSDFRQKNESLRMEPSFFELTVAMAFDYFRKEQVEVAVIEVGLGGRLDSTNIITPEVSVITNISFDHTGLLGDTLEKIAGEKAGIIKPGIPVVVGETSPEYDFVFKRVAAEKQASLTFADQIYTAGYSMLLPEGKQMLHIRKGEEMAFDNLKVELLGIYQRMNVPTVLQTIAVLQGNGWLITREQIYNGLSYVIKNTGLMGRWQIIGHNPMVVCDTGHNPAGIKLVVEQIKNTPWKQLHIVMGMVNDKDQDEVLSLLPPNATYYFTRARIPRATLPEELLAKASRFGLHGKCYQTVPEALAEARANSGIQDLIFVGGSTFVVAEIL
jgi:dihydrofolate synthase/folylpolyglutamate synthase